MEKPLNTNFGFDAKYDTFSNENKDPSLDQQKDVECPETSDLNNFDSEGQTENVQNGGPPASTGDELGHISTDNFASGDRSSYNEIIENIGCGKFQYLVFLSCSFSFSSLQVYELIMSMISDIILCEWNDYLTLLIPIIASCGYILGAIGFGVISDVFGRKTSILISNFVMAAFLIGSAFSPSVQSLAAVTFFLGLASGGCIQSLIYFSEILPIMFRTVGVCSLFVGSITCILLSLLFGWFVLISGKWHSWIGINAIFPILSFIITIPLPDSAIFLLKKENTVGTGVKALQIAAHLNSSTIPGQTITAKEAAYNRGNPLRAFLKNLRVGTLIIFALYLFSGVFLVGSYVNGPLLVKMYETCDDHTTYNMTSECKTYDKTELTYDLSYYALGFISVGIAAALGHFCGRKNSISLLFGIAGILTFILIACLNLVARKYLVFISRSVVHASMILLYIFTIEFYPTEIRGVMLGIGRAIFTIGILVSPELISLLLLDYSMSVSLSFCGCFAVMACIIAYLLPAHSENTGFE